MVITKKTLLPIAVVLLTGIAGAVLRYFELRYAIDVRTGLYDFGAMSCVLPILTAAVGVFCAVLAITKRHNAVGAFTEAFKIKTTASSAVYLTSAVVIVFAGVLKIVFSISDGSVAHLLFGVLTVVCGASYIALLRARRTGVMGEVSALFANIPLFWACFLLVFTFTEHPVEPVSAIFAYDLLASCALLLSVYRIIGTIFNRRAAAPGVFASLFAIYLLITAGLSKLLHVLITGSTYYMTDSPFRMVCYAAVLLTLIFDAAVFLNAEVRQPKIPEPKENAVSDVENEPKDEN